MNNMSTLEKGEWFLMTNNIPFSDRDLYDVAVKQIYDSKGLKPGDKLPINEKFTVTDIQHDPQTGFDAMAVKDDKGNIMIVRVGEEMNHMVQRGINKFIEFKDKLFEMAYSFIKESVQTLFRAAEIIELLGESAVHIMADILTLQWNKILHHVIEKLDDFQHDAKHDFKVSKRGFDHELAAEIGRELSELARKIHAFSEKVYKVKGTFGDMELGITSQLKSLGGELCLSY